MLLKRCDREEDELIIFGDFNAGSRNDHRREGFVALDEVLLSISRHRNQMGLEVFRILDEEGGVDNWCQ